MAERKMRITARAPETYEEYRRHVRKCLDDIIKILARISVGDMNLDIDPDTLPDNEFSEMICGLMLMVDDLADARQSVEEQSRFNRIRGEVWKAASAEFTDRNALIDALLARIGPEMRVERISYYSIDWKGGSVVCTNQWYRQSAPPTVGLRFGTAFIAQFIGKQVVEFSLDRSDADSGPIHKLMHANGISSLLAVISGPPDRPEGFFTFTHPDPARIWSQTEISILRELVAILTAKMAQIEAEEALRLSNLELERRIGERTLELEQANRELQQDIDERIRTEQALRESEEQFRGVAEKSPNMIFINVMGSVVYVNEKVEQVMGYRREEILDPAFDFMRLIAPECHADIRRHFEQHRGGNEVPPYEYNLVTKSGRVLRAIHATRLIRYEGRPAILGVITDITEKQEMEYELLKARKLESIGLLAGGIAHDFNNILTGIITSVFMAKMMVGDKGDAHRLLAEAEKACFRASKLTRQLLTFSRGGTPLKEPAFIREIIEEAASFCLSGSRSVCRLDIQDSLPAVNIDRGQIDQVLNNLIINADQAMPAGGSVTIRATSVQIGPAAAVPLPPGPYVCVGVSDTGVGIAPENLHKIFDPYFTTKSTGTGLGLATAYSIIHKHGGYLTAQSTPGKGSVFTFYLPACGGAESPRTLKLADRLTSGAGTILLLDDDEIVRLTMEKLLRRAGYEVTAVATGQLAIDCYRKAFDDGRPYSAVVFDLTIAGGKGGAELIQEILAIDPGARAIVMSGYADSPIMADYREFGFKARIVKPFTVGELTESIRQVTTS